MPSWDNSPTNPEDFVGMVYEILELDTGMRYIGIKRFWRTEKKKPTKYKMTAGSFLKDKKGKRILNKRTTKQHIVRESDWKQYNTSSPIMQKKLETNPDNYYKKIVKCCKSVTEMKCLEAYMQLDFYMSGRWDKLYNQMINLRINIRKGDKQCQK